MKLKWKISDKPSSKFSYFNKRPWPIAEDESGTTIVKLECDDSYIPSRVKRNDHPAVSVWIADYKCDKEKYGKFQLRKLKREFKTLKEAKEAAQIFVNFHEIMFDESLRV